MSTAAVAEPDTRARILAALDRNDFVGVIAEALAHVENRDPQRPVRLLPFTPRHGRGKE